ncbi:MAG: hypothetical protein R3C04_11645 [Hyphomonas sp.]
MRFLIPLMACLAVLPASAQLIPRLMPGSYIQELTVDVEIVSSETGTILDSWTDRDRYQECREADAALALDAWLDHDPRCTYEETARSGGHVEFSVTCDYDEMLMTGTGKLDYQRADLTGFEQAVSLFGYSGEERRMTFVRQPGAWVRALQVH